MNIENSENNDDFSLQDEIKSRTQVKKEAHEVTDFGKKLIALNADKLKKMPLDEKIIEEILKAKNMQRIALKRQTQYIGKLLRQQDLQNAYEKYDSFTQQSKTANARLHRLEQLREQLLDPATTKTALASVVAQQKNIDIQQLRQLIRNHHKEISQQKPAKSYRLIFQLLKDADS
jgi:ribosome-associated protein